MSGPRITLSEDFQTASVYDRKINCRLVMPASGGKEALANKISFARQYHHSLISLIFAFNIALNNGK